MKEIVLKLSLPELRHLLGCLENVRESRVYWGNKEHFDKRHERLLSKLKERLVEPCDALEELQRLRSRNEELRRRVAELEQWHNGHMPECAGSDPANGCCGCGYLQGQAYRDLRTKVQKLENGIAEHRQRVLSNYDEPECSIRENLALWNLVKGGEI